VLLGEAMWADMLAQSIAFERRMLPAAPALRTNRFDSMVAPLRADGTKGPMPALAALATITPSVFANHSGARRTRHAI
jgi:hypothetical protein